MVLFGSAGWEGRVWRGARHHRRGGGRTRGRRGAALWRRRHRAARKRWGREMDEMRRSGGGLRRPPPAPTPDHFFIALHSWPSPLSCFFLLYEKPCNERAKRTMNENKIFLKNIFMKTDRSLKNISNWFFLTCCDWKFILYLSLILIWRHILLQDISIILLLLILPDRQRQLATSAGLTYNIKKEIRFD